MSTVYCHSTNEGQVTIYYNDAKDQNSQAMIQSFHEYGLFSEIIDTYSTWANQRDKVAEVVHALSEKGQVIGVSDLEVNDKHNRALTIIWYMKKY